MSPGAAAIYCVLQQKASPVKFGCCLQEYRGIWPCGLSATRASVVLDRLAIFIAQIYNDRRQRFNAAGYDGRRPRAKQTRKRVATQRSDLRRHKVDIARLILSRRVGPWMRAGPSVIGECGAGVSGADIRVGTVDCRPMPGERSSVAGRRYQRTRSGSLCRRRVLFSTGAWTKLTSIWLCDRRHGGSNRHQAVRNRSAPSRRVVGRRPSAGSMSAS